MTNMICDGIGKGYLVKVNSDHQMHVAAVNVTMEHYVNHQYAEAYNIIWDMSVTSGSDVCTLYILNTGNRTLILEGFSAQVSADITVYAKFGVTGTPGNVTDMEAGNLNAGSGNVLSATTLQGDGITGLSGGRVVWKSKVPGSNQSGFVNFDADLIIPSQQTMTVYATSTINWTSVGFFIGYVVPNGGNI